MRPARSGLFYGAGDLFASALSALLVRGAALEDALETASSLVTDSVERTLLRGTPRRFGMDFEGALPAFSVSLRCGDIREVVRLPEGERVPFERDGDETRFTARALDLFDMYELRR